MDARLLRRLAELILTERPFSADDITDNGALTIKDNHDPNASQNAIGSVFPYAARRRWIKQVDTTRSKSPHRKSGLIRVWIGTVHGETWAIAYLQEHP